MSHRGGQDPQPGYMDEVCVKISEKYKPPPRINLAITYAQRLYLNKQIQYSIIPYDFSLETSMKDRVKELRSARRQLYEDQAERLKEARLKYEQFLEEKKSKESISNVSQESDIPEEQILKASGTTAEVMYPTSYSHILTPTPLSSTDRKSLFKCNSNDKSPFNISDFEADTSSPFDNMELKTINDIEELAQVLKKGETSNHSYAIPYTDAAGQAYPNYVSLPSTSGQSTTVSTYAMQDTQNLQYSPYISQTLSPYTHSISSRTYNNLNGYYYNSDIVQTNVNQNFKPYNYDNSPSKLSKENTKSIPDIMKTLESELKYATICQNGVPSDPNKSQESSNEVVIKSIDLDDVFSHLPKNLQYLSKDISLMGFPLSRVARVCQTIGDNQKKIVEHLIVMSELLDLGFSEEEVSRALLQCNNDRDKALDILIA